MSGLDKPVSSEPMILSWLELGLGLHILLSGLVIGSSAHC